MKRYDVIVVGAGHAGCEAAYAAARMGADTLLITTHLDHIAQMSCNPAIGGVAKGHVVREIDALGGIQGVITDAATLQFRMLNRTKGPAVHSPRAQCDKALFSRLMKTVLEQTPNLSLLQSEVVEFKLENGNIKGVVTLFGEVIEATAVILTTGTFLNGLLHYGLRHYSGGRAGDAASIPLARALRDQLGLQVGRLKTGTPPRLLGRSIDFSAMTRQPSEDPEFAFSFRSSACRPDLPRAARRQLPCYGVYSTPETADVVREHLSEAPMYQGVIEGVGARYCPSFEDKVVRFSHHPRHLLYLEPESAECGEYYINGISTSLPPSVQLEMLATIPGLERAVVTRYAYAIEYDFIHPSQLSRTLQQKRYPNLFTAGQINGTSGYEEAAGQGLIAGMNAALLAAGKELVAPARDLSYIGVMIDDLVTKDIVEPYRLFTSRAEYRLHLRQDNADLRLTARGHAVGLVNSAQYQEFAAYAALLDEWRKMAQTIRVGEHTVYALLKQPEAAAEAAAAQAMPPLPDTPAARRMWEELRIEARYDGYLQREAQSIAKLHRLENWKIPADFDFGSIPSLRNESRMKLLKVRPLSLAQAERIDGVTPAEIALIQVHLARLRLMPEVEE
ncbi:MAG: tRNA uridine-5-carboxymethylaminomethyl(34) synthesis enzyme MnmG [Lentisphaeria bacterium]|nr:tRNA uridine-5-carboxymethylaminomethyl(34) synthesis enzyme MnmG [Lentisphaeria bacterium]